MTMDQDLQRIVALDIGTNKVATIVAEVNRQGELEIIGIGTHQSRGLKKGVVVNIESTVQSIQRAVEEAELMAGCTIESVYAGIAGSHIRSLNSHGIVAIRDREVFSQDVDRVIDAAQAMAIPADQKILHVLPQEYIIDTQEGVKEPLGMSGVRLEANDATSPLFKKARAAAIMSPPAAAAPHPGHHATARQPLQRIDGRARHSWQTYQGSRTQAKAIWYRQ